MQCLFEYSGASTVDVFEMDYVSSGRGPATLCYALGVAHCDAGSRGILLLAAELEGRLLGITV